MGSVRCSECPAGGRPSGRSLLFRESVNFSLIVAHFIVPLVLAGLDSRKPLPSSRPNDGVYAFFCRFLQCLCTAEGLPRSLLLERALSSTPWTVERANPFGNVGSYTLSALPGAETSIVPSGSGRWALHWVARGMFRSMSCCTVRTCTMVT